MKYINFKRYKFSTILKNINLRRYNFLKVNKYLNYINRYLNYKRYNFRPFYKYFDIRPFYKYFDIRQYRLPKIYRYINYKKIKIIPLYVLGLTIMSALIYLSVPIFFTYNKSHVNKTLCSDLKIKCEIKGKINYAFIPYPKLKAKELVIYDLIDKDKILAQFETVEVKLALKDLLNKEKLNFGKIQLHEAQINLNYEKISEYKKHFAKDIS